MKVPVKLLIYGALSLWTAMSVVAPSSAQASPEFSWTSQEPTYIRTLPDVRNSSKCTTEKVKIASDTVDSQTGHFYREIDGCVTHGATIDIANVNTQSTRAIRMNGDTLYHEFAADSTTGYLVSGTDSFVNLAFNPMQFSRTPSVLVTYKSLPVALSVVSRNSLGIVTRYETDQTKGTKWLTRTEDGATHYYTAQSTVTSGNGRYLLAYVDGAFYVKIDLQTGTQTITGYRYSSYYDYTPPNPLAVSDDGRYAYVGGAEDIFDFHDCGDDFVANGPQSSRTLLRQCSSRNLSAQIVAAAGYQAYSSAASFVDDNQALLVTSHLYPGMYGYTGPSDPKTIEFHGANYSPNPRLDYLALGDSYTSGEGDIAKKPNGTSYYLPGTENDKECHVSTRSYPFLLTTKWNLITDKAKTVACSGALLSKDYSANISTYNGQHEEVKYVSVEKAEKTKQDALSFYHPGIVPQLEFVKKYHPKTLTLTGSGNDVGFSNILRYCASDIVEWFVADYTCEYVDDGILNEVLNDSIDSQYALIKRNIELLQSASPETRITYIGYPSFIAGSTGSCALNSAVLDDKERDMINAAVSRLNGVIKAATIATGSQFIDIEESLNGGRICEGSKYMTGVWTAGIINVLKNNNEAQNAFHPNALGHEKIADSIKNKIPTFDYFTKPSEILVRPPEPHINTYAKNMLSNNTTHKNGTLRVNLGPNSLKGSSEVVMTGFSTPTNIGTFTAGDDGSLDVLIALSDKFNTGIHLITLEGKAPSGEAIRYFQQFFVEGDNENDIDDDGILNVNDGCTYIKSWYDETGKNLCDIYTAKDENSKTGNLDKSGKESTMSLAGKFDLLYKPVLISEEYKDRTLFGGENTTSDFLVQKDPIFHPNSTNITSDNREANMQQDSHNDFLWLFILTGVTLMTILVYHKVWKNSGK